MIISDIHGNYEALKAVLNDGSKQKVKDVVVLGDICGYGPQAHECIKVIRSKGFNAVLGNHDAGIIGKVDITAFRGEAVDTWREQAMTLPTEDIEWLKKLPYFYCDKDFTAVHGSPKDPMYEYITNSFVAMENNNFFPTRICFYGHTHRPAFFAGIVGEAMKEFHFDDMPMELSLTRKYLINPGSVGQPRDGDKRASYVIYDSSEQAIELKRVVYDIKTTQKLIITKKYSKWLAYRLAYGG
jgi:predicted phosphodiesterase